MEMTSFNVKNLGCLFLVFIILFGLFFAKYLVPMVPLLVTVLIYINTKKLKASIFVKAKSMYELTEGKVQLEGKAISREEEFLSSYFKQKCIGYIYKEEEYVPTEDGYNTNLRSQKMECKNFILNTSTGIIKVNAARLDLLNLPSKLKIEHSLKQGVNEIGHVEHVLKNNDDVIIIGNVVRNTHGQFEVAKLNNEPFFATTKSKVEGAKISFQIFLRLLPWFCLLYLIVNYFLFFAPTKNIPRNDFIVYFSIFGLPILFIVFRLIGKDKNDWFSQLFQYLSSVCIITSLLSFPLVILFYMIELDFYRTYSIFISIAIISSLSLIFNYKKLGQLNTEYKNAKNSW